MPGLNAAADADTEVDAAIPAVAPDERDPLEREHAGKANGMGDGAFLLVTGSIAAVELAAVLLWLAA